MRHTLLAASALTFASTVALGQVNEKPVQENAATVTAPPASGFTIRIDGDVVTEDPGVTNIARRVDVALEQADVEVVFDGLGAEPRLDMEIVGSNDDLAAGQTITLQSALNYPSYVTRGEFRVIERAAISGPRTVVVIPVAPNGMASLTLPEGSDLIVVHRVYDSTGRFDETEALSLIAGDGRANADGVEEGSDFAARRSIPVYGGAVTVRGTGVAQGARVQTLGETVVPDGNGGFILQRILPAGDYDVSVVVAGAGQSLDQVRRVSIPKSEWFSTGTIDLTAGYRDSDAEGNDTYTRGRVAGYIDGRTESGIEVTASLDTGEGDLSDIFRDLDEKDPRQLLLRVDPSDLYPTYGDDSTLVDNTPTSGKVYLRVAREGNHLLWGDFDSELGGSALVRNERTLYGLQIHAETRDATSRGEARASVDVFAAQPDRLPQRDAFLGTGGSVYFLEKQDIGAGTETVTIQYRDPDTGRVIDTVSLDPGTDYDINYIQGIVILAEPLQSSLAQSTVVTDPTSAADATLVVQYEYTPTAGDLDGYSYGGRVEGWITDSLRLGLSGVTEQTGIADQSLVGVDIRFEKNESTYLQFDYAESEGPGFGSTFSADGGLVVETVDGGNGSGRAFKVEGKADFATLGFGLDGAVSAYFEDRTEGFSNLDTTVTDTTRDERLWGIAVDALPSERTRISAYFDSYENAAGEHDRTGGLEVGLTLTERTEVEFGLEHVDRNRASDNGERTDVAARLSYALSNDADVYVVGQATIHRDGLDQNDRVGFGGNLKFGNGWSFQGEVSDGSLGFGARALARREDGEGNELYFGYELEPDRELSGVTLAGRDRGRFVTGGKRQLGTDVTVFGENTYDAFGRHRSLTSAYGLTYTPREALRYSAALEIGRVDDNDTTDFDRHALSLGLLYDTEDLTASGRIEYRVEEGTRTGQTLDSDTLLLTADARYKIDDSRRFVGSFSFANTDTDESSILDGQYTDLTLGYAYRPVDNDRLNLLARYRYLDDQIGQRIDGTDEDGPRQRSHVFSIDATYAMNPRWTVGGKLGYRISESAETEADTFTQNDAWLAIANVSYHMVHEWDALVEVRSLNTVQGGTSDTGIVAVAYKHINENVKLGLGHNFGQFSDDLTDLVQDDQGVFVNLVAKF